MDSLPVSQVVGGFICLYLSCSLASSAGLGGGGVNVPVLLVILQYDYKEATVLSLCAVLGNHFSQTTINWSKSNPQLATRALIYWDLVMIFLPAQLAGSTLSTTFSTSFPETPLLILGMIVVSFAIYKSIEKGRSLYASENLEIKNRTIDVQEDVDENLPSSAMSDNNNEPLLIKHNNNYSHIEEKPKIQLDMYVFLWIATAWMYYAGLYLVLQFGVTSCSALYYAILGGSFLPLVGFLYLCVRYLTNKQARGDAVLEGDLVFSESHAHFLLPVAALAIGFVSVLLGLGSAELTAPYFLSLGVPPIVSSASTSVISLLYSSSSLLHYAVLGRIEIKAAAIMFVVGLAGGATGRTFALYVLSRYKRASFICFILTFILSIGLGLLIDDIVVNERDWTFHSLC